MALTFAVSWRGPLPLAFQGSIFLLSRFCRLEGFRGLGLLLFFGSWLEEGSQ